MKKLEQSKRKSRKNMKSQLSLLKEDEMPSSVGLDQSNPLKFEKKS